MSADDILTSHSKQWLLAARVVLIFLILAWMFVIFQFSAQDSTDSTAASDKVVEVIEKVVEVTTGKNISVKLAQPKYRQYVEYAVRKCAHMFIYFVLSITVMLFLFTFPRMPMIIRMILSVIVCFIYACTDEYHQSFVGGRSPAFKDVMFDTTGAIIGLLGALIIYCVIYTIYSKIQESKINSYNKQLNNSR